jgi:hypothetical protein
VIEMRFNVVRSGVPDLVTTARTLRDFLPPVEQRDAPVRGETLPGEAAMTGVA